MTEEVKQTKRIARAFAPATVANVGCGFDVLGFALSRPGDVVEAELLDQPGVHILSIEGDGGQLPLVTSENTAGVAVAALLQLVGFSGGMGLRIKKEMPLGSGLGSSAASAAAALVAANSLLGDPLSRRELLPMALEAERIACGAAHADNVAPALLGGFVLIRSYDPLDVVALPSPADLYCVVIHPNLVVKTRDAREVMRRNLSLQTAVKQWGNLGGLVAGLYSGDYSLIGRSLQDAVAEPVRSLLIPGFDAVKEAAMQQGALGCSISGSGPSVFALCHGQNAVVAVSDAMQAAFASIGISSEAYVGQVNGMGAVLIG